MSTNDYARILKEKKVRISATAEIHAFKLSVANVKNILRLPCHEDGAGLSPEKYSWKFRC